jgi:hypothetical protein
MAGEGEKKRGGEGKHSGIGALGCPWEISVSHALQPAPAQRLLLHQLLHWHTHLEVPSLKV